MDFIEIELEKITYNDEERQRKELDDNKVSGATIEELASSIKNLGLINPIIINRDYSLRAGRRRLEAHRVLGRATILARFVDTLTPLQAKELEFDENHKRKQLTWQEEAAAIKEIHEFRQTAATEKGEEWSIRKTAETLGLSVGKVSEDLQLASHLDNTRVTGRPSRRGAITTARRERELDLVRELAARRAQDIGVRDADSTLTGGVLALGDCRKFLATLADNSVDLVVTDPPWGIDLDKSSQWATKWLATYDDSPTHIQQVLRDAFPHIFRVLKPTSHIYCFFPIQEIEWWVKLLTEVGFYVRQRPLIWYKSGQPSISDPYASFLPCYEAVLWGFKPGDGGIRRFFARPTPEAAAYPRQPGLWHENEKPIDLITTFIEASSSVNEVVLDPFAGGASVLAAAFGVGRYYLGSELDEVNFVKARRRMTEMESRQHDVVEESENLDD